MPRNAAGVYTLPNPPVVTDTTILAPDENTTRDDLAAELTNSLDRGGRGGMLAPFRIADGTMAAPGLGFLNDPDNGFWRSGPDTWHAVAQGANVLTFTPTTVTIPADVTISMLGTAAFANLDLSGGTLTLRGPGMGIVQHDGTNLYVRNDMPANFLFLGAQNVNTLQIGPTAIAALVPVQFNASATVLGTLSASYVLAQANNPGNIVTIQAQNTDNTDPASGARLAAFVGGDGGGDPQLYLEIPFVIGWSVGIDNSDGNSLKIGSSGAVGTNNAITINTGTAVLIDSGLLSLKSFVAGGLLQHDGANMFIRNDQPAGALLFLGASGVSTVAMNSTNVNILVTTGIGNGLLVANQGSTVTIGATVQDSMLNVKALEANGQNITLHGNSSNLAKLRGVDSAFTIEMWAIGNDPSHNLLISTHGIQRLFIDAANGCINTGGVINQPGFTAPGDISQPAGGVIKSRSTFSAWVRHDAAGTIIASSHVASVTKNSPGNYTANIVATVFDNANYGWMFGPCIVVGPSASLMYKDDTKPHTTTAFSYQITTQTGAAQDPIPGASLFVGFVPAY